MRDYLQQQQDRRDFLQRKVDIARAQIREGQGVSDQVVEAEFATRRALIADQR
ncbi:hypothetical protein U1839_15005 [Sphingomonas sp. RT2P30]|uniref:hypothetical protein n=1 Tax=Parasphingomonas halimpatiens TaxID=3096162 RepID=UPI002FCB9238